MYFQTIRHSTANTLLDPERSRVLYDIRLFTVWALEFYFVFILFFFFDRVELTHGQVSLFQTRRQGNSLRRFTTGERFFDLAWNFFTMILCRFPDYRLVLVSRVLHGRPITGVLELWPETLVKILITRTRAYIKNKQSSAERDKLRVFISSKILSSN